MELKVSERLARGNYTATETEPAAKKSKTTLDILVGEDESTSTSATYNFNTAQYSCFASIKQVLFVQSILSLKGCCPS